ncbi:DHHC family palmitoyltransferase [Sporobolomyces koalae]|uniref:DHHC family palmitoyltransferase n=1 Tax=Sporobolomyces koalae TaxID=500713 RepID=UPI00317A960C
MLPQGQARAAAGPLLTFPPSPPGLSSRPAGTSLPPIDHSPSSLSLLSSRSPMTTTLARSTRKPRSLCYRTLAATPLGFIYTLLGFSFYTVVYALAFDYLWCAKAERLKAFAVVATYAWLLYGCGGSLWKCYSTRAANYVETVEGLAKDEEEMVATATRLELHDAQGQDDEDEGDAREDEALLLGANGTAEGKRSRLGRKTMQVKSDGTKRFCRKCNILKPDRAHHCSTCQRCVLKMDHHCPWLGGGCVGFANYKFFLQFLMYVGALGIYISAVCFYSLVNYTSNEPSGFEMAPISWALAALLGIIFGSAVGLFGLYHLYLAANNRTTIEAMESPTTFLSTLPPAHLIEAFARQHASHPAYPGGPPRPYPSRAQVLQQLSTRLTPKQKLKLSRAKRRFNVYDLGWKRNLVEIFTSTGDNESRNRANEDGQDRRDRSTLTVGSGETTQTTSRWLEWIMPWGTPAGDGHAFPINLDNLRKLEMVCEEVWAEVEADERARGEQRGRRFETGLTREGSMGDETEDSTSDQDDDRPLRRA